MPNWCATNFLLRGTKEDIERFCKTVNDCYGKEDIKPNGFGKLWLGNLYAAFGYDTKNIPFCNRGGLRGALDANPDGIASFFGPNPSRKRLEPKTLDDKTSEVRFTVHTAWGPSDWFFDMLDEKFPDVQVAWKSTDEFGSFRYIHNREMLGEPFLSVEYPGREKRDFEPEQMRDAIDYINGITGLSLTLEKSFRDGRTTDDFWYAVGNWNMEQEQQTINLTIYEESC